MKKVLLVLVAMIATFNSFALTIDASAIDTTSTTQEFNSKMYEDFKQFVVLVGEKGGSAFAKGYDIFIAQQYLYATKYAILGFVGLILFIWGISLLKTAIKDAYEETKSIYLSIGIFVFITSIIMLFVCVLNIDVILQGYINPDYAAIKEIILMIRNNVK